MSMFAGESSGLMSVSEVILVARIIRITLLYINLTLFSVYDALLLCDVS